MKVLLLDESQKDTHLTNNQVDYYTEIVYENKKFFNDFKSKLGNNFTVNVAVGKTEEKYNPVVLSVVPTDETYKEHWYAVTMTFPEGFAISYNSECYFYYKTLSGAVKALKQNYEGRITGQIANFNLSNKPKKLQFKRDTLHDADRDVNGAGRFLNSAVPKGISLYMDIEFDNIGLVNQLKKTIKECPYEIELKAGTMTRGKEPFGTIKLINPETGIGRTLKWKDSYDYR